jgi:hypothetical protein
LLAAVGGTEIKMMHLHTFVRALSMELPSTLMKKAGSARQPFDNFFCIKALPTIFNVMISVAASC